MHSLLKRGGKVKMENNLLWDIIYELRDEVNVAQDGIADLNDVVKDLQAEAIEQIRDNKRLKGVLDMDSSLDDAIIKDAELMRELKVENERLSIDNLEKVKVINDANKQTIAERVKHYGIEFPYPKEYKAEADEYFSHNPKSKYVAFYMLSEYDVRDGERGDLMLYKDDAIVVIDNDNS